MDTKLHLIKKINNKVYRIVQKNFYEYHDELNGDIKTDKAPDYRYTTIEVQIKRKFIFWNFWSTIRSLLCKDKCTINIQVHNAKIWLYKNTTNG